MNYTAPNTMALGAPRPAQAPTPMAPVTASPSQGPQLLTPMPGQPQQPYAAPAGALALARPGSKQPAAPGIPSLNFAQRAAATLAPGGDGLPRIPYPVAKNFFAAGNPWSAGLAPIPQRPQGLGLGGINAWRQQYGDWLKQAGQQFGAFQQANPDWQQQVNQWRLQDQNARRAALPAGLIANRMGL